MSKAHARTLRTQPTRGEAEAWALLRRMRDEGISFRRQHPIGAYIVDFVCLRRRLIVEIDGASHRIGDAHLRDAQRDAWLAAAGYTMLRIDDRAVFGGDAWLDSVRAALHDAKDHAYRWKTEVHPLSLEGRGAGERVRAQSASVPAEAQPEKRAKSRAILTPPPAPSPSRGGGQATLPELPFWKTKALTEMSEAEWESLCDGCGKCCLIGLEDEDTQEIYLTDLSCKMFDPAKCQCGDYANRFEKVDYCVKLTPENIGELYWLPKTCAYRLVAAGKDLYWWHHLVSGSRETVHEANVSVRDKVKPERGQKVRTLMKRIVSYPEAKRKPRARK